MSPWSLIGRGRILSLVACLVIAAAGCGGTKTVVPTPPVNDPPQIACPTATPVESLDGNPQAVTFADPTVTLGQPPVTASCNPPSGTQFGVGQNPVTCTATDTLGRSATCSFQVTVSPPPKLSTTSFLAFGDSITWGEDGQAFAVNPLGQNVFFQLSGHTYPDDLQAELQARYRLQSPIVTNAGLRGETLSDGTAFPRYVGYTSSRAYAAVLIMEGSNDVNAAAGDSLILPQAIAVLRQMIGDAKSRGIRPFLATIPPMLPGGFRAKGYLVVPTYNDQVRSLAAAEAVPLVDVYAAFGSDASSLIGFDGLHPNAAGYQRIADTFFTAIKKALETVQTPAFRSLR